MVEAKPETPILVPTPHQILHRDPHPEALPGTRPCPGALGPRNNVKYRLWTKGNKTSFSEMKVLDLVPKTGWGVVPGLDTFWGPGIWGWGKGQTCK